MAVLFDMRWNDATATPVFQMIHGTQRLEKLLSFGEEFCVSMISSTPTCTGSFHKSEYFPCPDGVVGTKKCERCKKAEEYFPCQFCNGFNCIRFSPQKIENCDADHMVYLALFSEDIIKVGVSRMSRGKARQFEQGSHMTRIFATGISGVQARRIETNLMKAGFADKIPATQKRNILFPDISEQQATNLLEKKYQYAKDHITSVMPEMKKYIVENEIWDMRSVYAGSLEKFLVLEKSTKPIHFLSLQQGDSVGGTLAMVKGSYLVIETNTELVILFGKEYIGQDLCFDPCEAGILLASGGFQGALF